MQIGQIVTFKLNIPYVGIKVGAGKVIGEGRFAILGETYSVESDGSGDFAKGSIVEVKVSSILTRS